MLQPRNVVELLSPAKDLACGMAAVDHGADAVYIGAPLFGARKSAANSIDDIARLVDYAHLYGVRIFAALNTLLFDNEIDSAVDLAWQLYRAGVDALIVQDFGLLECDMPPIELHASTQMDNRSAEKVRFLEDVGFAQVVLARELSREQIQAIASRTKVRLECFIHGALCVSYSGQCFMSQCVNGRSANRGDCAQPCRLPYTLTSADGRVLEKDRYLLSLKDMNQTANIEALIDAGVSSFKIEGRLKDAGYVSNVTLHYRRVIDEILSRRPDLRRASQGECAASFTPDPQKSFNRGFTTYFFDGRRDDICRPQTPKSIGEYLGKATKCGKQSFVIDGKKAVANGDGLCFFNPDGSFDGLKVNRADGQTIFPNRMPRIANGADVYRNSDVAFDAVLRADATRRVIDIDMMLDVGDHKNFSLSIIDADGHSTTSTMAIDAEPANDSQASRAAMQRQLAKLGSSPYRCNEPTVTDRAAQFFLRASDVNALRRLAVDNHSKHRQQLAWPPETPFAKTDIPFPEKIINRNGNIINNRAKAFYMRHGAEVKEWGYERQSANAGQIVMTTKHCIMALRGNCLKQNPKARRDLPLTLHNGHDRYSVEFDCKECQMIIRKM